MTCRALFLAALLMASSLAAPLCAAQPKIKPARAGISAADWGTTQKGDKVRLYTLTGKGRGKNTAEKVGGGAAVGAILGGIFGGGKGAAIGAAAGAGVGAGANAVTKGQEVSLPSESIVRFRLTNAISITR